MPGSRPSNYHGVQLSAEDRLKLIQTLSQLPDGQLNQILFAINIPAGILPGNTSPSSDRANELLKWAESPTGPGLHRICEILETILNQRPIFAVSSGLSEKIFNVPYHRNNFFTGRERIIEDLRDSLLTDEITILLGLGGIGKTQIAVEYAYRYQDSYQHVFWLQADTVLSLENEFIELSNLLNVPQKEVKESVFAVQRKLEEMPDWLLILDGFGNPEISKKYIPRRGNGHVILTSRNQACQAIEGNNSIEVFELLSQEALDFICNRVKRKELDALELTAAEELINNLGCLPLALEQAGAYIFAKKVLIRDYVISLKKRKIDLLEKAMPAASDYPESITSTWSINFMEIEQNFPVSADIMRFSAFLNGENIPLYIINKAASKLGENIKIALSEVEDDPVIINDHLEPLSRYSLIQLDPDTRSYSTHHLVQEVLKIQLSQEEYRLWAQRVVLAISHVFPEIEFENWPLCEVMLMHAKAAANITEKLDFEFPESIELLNKLGNYLLARGQYDEAEVMLTKALSINRKIFGDNHEEVATSNHNLGALYFTQGRYVESEVSLLKALSIRKILFGGNSIDVAASLFLLGFLYYLQGKYRESEPLLIRSSEIRKEKLGNEHTDVLCCLHELGNLYTFQGRYEEAESLYLSNLCVRERTLKADHPDLAESLNNLALLYYYQGRYLESESLYLRVLEIDKKNLGEEHPDTASSYNNMALLYTAQKRYVEAEAFCLKSLEIRQNAFGENHPLVAQSMNNLAGLYESKMQYKKAESLYIRALEMERNLLGSNHPDVADSLNDLAGLYCKLKIFDKARNLYTQSLDISQRLLGNNHRYVAVSLRGLGLILEAQDKYVEAETFLVQAVDIALSMSGESHSFTRSCQKDLERIRHCNRGGDAKL